MEIVKKIPYKGRIPSAARHLISLGKTSAPRQREKVFQRTTGVDITYRLKDMKPKAFQDHSDTLMLIAYQESMRYNKYKWKFARFEVKIGRLKRGRDIPEVATYQTAMHDEPEIMVYGPGYETKEKWFLVDRVEQILDITKRYSGKINKQNPYVVTHLIISIREELT